MSDIEEAAGLKRKIRTADGAEFLVDQELMIAQSEYLKVLLNFDSEEVIVIREISGQTMKLIVDLLEGKTVMLNTENVVDLLKASDFLMIDSVLRKIRASLPHAICETNCIRLYNATSSTLEYLDIFRIIELYVQIHFQSVIDNSTIEELSFKHFERLLFDENLSIRSEEVVWDAIVRWIGTNKEKKRKAIPMLLRCIRLKACEVSVIQKIVLHPMLKENEFCRAVVAKNKKLSSISNLRVGFIESIKKLSPDSVNFGPRTGHLRRVFCRLDHDYKCCETVIYIQSTADDSKVSRVTNVSQFTPKCALSWKNKLFLFDVDAKILAFDLLQGKEISFPLPEKEYDRITFSIVGGRIFASMVNGKPSVHVIVDVFDPENNKWRFCSSFGLTTSKADIICIEAAVLGNLIYVFARACISSNHYASFASVYNSEKNSWSSFELPCDYTSYRRHFFTMASYKGALQFTWTESLSVKRFDLCSRIWQSRSTLPFQFDVPHAVVHDGNLILYEKSGRSSTPLRWDDELDEWRPESTNRSALSVNIDDVDVWWKFHDEFRKRDWQTAVKEWT